MPGKNAAEHVQKAATLAVEKGGDGLTEERREIFYEGLELIAANLKSASRDGLDTKK